MAQTFQYTNCWYDKITELGTHRAQFSAQQQSEVKSNPVSGSWITFPDGSKFRRPTTYSRRTYGWKGIQGQSDNGYHSVPSHVRNVRSSSGGYKADDLMSSNCPGIAGISFNKLYDQVVIPVMMQNEAVTKALLDLAGQKANLGETFATWKQTINLVRSPASALLESLKYVRKVKKFRPFLNRTIRDISRNGPIELVAAEYLKYVYGWKPLMQDIYNIMAAAKDKSSRPLLVSGKGHSSQQKQSKMATYTNLTNRCQTILGPVDEQVKVSCKVFGRIDPNYSGIRALNQLGLLNPASLAWELVKYSFVVDWFIPVGAVLNALSAPAGLVFVAGTVSVKTEATGPYSHFNYDWRNGGNGTTNLSYQDAKGTVFYKAYRRNALSNWPLPGFWINSNPFSGDRPLKALALGIIGLRNSRI